jgi:hypothetical protein
LLKRVHRFQLERLGPDAVRSRLIADGRTVAEVAGRVDELQLGHRDEYLLITSDGDPFENELHLYLLGPSGDVVDGVSLGLVYHSGTLSDVEIVGDTLEFSFFGAERWRVTIMDSPRMWLPPNPFARLRSEVGAWRRHRLKVDRLESRVAPQ